jgi:hypothetical protein
MPYFVNVRTDEVVLREGKEPLADLYDACGRAALLASDLTDRYSKESGTPMPSDSLAVVVVDNGGNLLFRIPIQVQARGRD